MQFTDKLTGQDIPHRSIFRQINAQVAEYDVPLAVAVENVADEYGVEELELMELYYDEDGAVS